MSDGMVRKWVRMFNGGRTNVHDENQSGWPSLVTDDLEQFDHPPYSPDLAPFAVLGMTLNFLFPPNHFLIPTLQGLISTCPLTVPVYGSLGVLKPVLDTLSGVGES
ncbi:hypothetical protein J6590_084284 [Homalodisca vitripennis]|nr:hypothetical protein J6590_084284 [Homalodisca vitripennis]